MSKAVLLLSGGLDSTTLLAQAIHEGVDVHAMTFRYGQRHASEIDAARRIAAHYSVRDHVIADIDLRVGRRRREQRHCDASGRKQCPHVSSPS